MNLQTNSFSKDIIIKLSERTQQSLIKERDAGGGKTLSYIAGSTVIDRLNNIFGHAWNWEVKSFWIEKGQPFFVKKNKYSLTHLTDNELSTNEKGDKGLVVDQGGIAHVLGTLTIMTKDSEGYPYTIVKEGFGSKSVIGKQSEQESIFKAASTDALKKAASMLGIGLDLYRSSEEQDYHDELNNPWTLEMREKFETEREQFRAICDSKGDDFIISKILEYSNGTSGDFSYVTPDNIVSFINFVTKEPKKNPLKK